MPTDIKIKMPNRRKGRMKSKTRKAADKASLDPMVLPDEIAALIRYHDSAAKYQSNCHKTQTWIANQKPLYTFGEHQTKADWLRTAAEWKRSSKWHEERSAFWKRQNP
jgi:hypothetical protein